MLNRSHDLNNGGFSGRTAAVADGGKDDVFLLRWGTENLNLQSLAHVGRDHATIRV